MLPREFLRENAERLLAEYPERYSGSGLERFAELDRRRRDTVTRIEEKRRRRNELSAARGKPSPEIIEETKALKEEIRLLEAELEQSEAELAQVEQGIPNVPQPDVPKGRDETANRVERTWGEPRRFDFEAGCPLGPRAARGQPALWPGAQKAGGRLFGLEGARARPSRGVRELF